MTPTTDLERPTEMDRVLAEFMADGRDTLPDRAVDAVLAAVDRTSQRRSPIAQVRAAISGRPRRAVLAVVPVGLVALLLGGLVLTTGRPDVREDTPAPATAAPASPLAPGPSSPASVQPAMHGVTPAQGVSAPGTIVFGLDADGGPLLSIRPDGSGLHEITPAGACCAVLSPGVTENGSLEAGATVMFVTDVVSYAGLPVFKPVAPDAPGLDEAWTQDNLVDAGLVGDTRLYPRAWTGLDLAFEGVSPSDPARDGIYLSVDNGGGMLIGEFVRMTGAPDGAHDIPIAFSPDGTQLLFLRDAGIADGSQLGILGDLYVIDIGGFGPKGMPDRPGTPRRLNPAGTLVLFSDAMGASASWAPEGSAVAFAAFPRLGETIDSAARVYVGDAMTGASSPITSGSRNSISARWSPDGTWIAYDGRASGGSRNVWVVRPDGTGAREVASFSGGSCCATWSPDSRYLLAQGLDADGVGLFIISADGSGTSRLLSTDSPHGPVRYAWGAWPANP